MAYLAQATAGVKTRSQTRLSSHLEKNLLAYAAAATAAGMGILTGPPAADAKIIYTKTNQQISGKVPLDLNNDGTVDFYLETFHISSCPAGDCHGFQEFFVQPGSGSGNEVVAAETAYATWGAALKAGAEIGTSDRFTGRVDLGKFWWAERHGEHWSGPWVNGGHGVTNRYLGVKFEIKGKYHYGWARLSVTRGGDYAFTPTLTGYAYETIPNKAIIAGKTKGPDVVTMPPDTLGSLAWGRR